MRKSGVGSNILGNLADISYGITLGGYRATLPEMRNYLRVANVQRDALELSEIKTINCTESEARRFEIFDGDVLIVEGHASPSEIGRSAVWRSEVRGALHQNHLIRARCNKELLPEYLNIYINSFGGQDYFRSRAKSSSGLNTINSTVVKEILELAAEVVEAEKDTDPKEERDKAKEALTELFTEAKNGNTHIIVERIVADIDDVVKKVRFPDWQHTTQGERLVQKELRKTLLKYRLHTDQDLFDRAYAYIKQYY